MDYMLDPPDDDENDGPYDDDFGKDFEDREYDEESADASSNWQNSRDL